MNDKPFVSYPISDRRTFLKNAIIGTTGLTLSSMAYGGCSSILTRSKSTMIGTAKMRKVTYSGPSTVSLFSSTDQRDASYNALKPLQGEIENAIGEKQVVIKVNMGQVASDRWLNATDVNFTRGILDFLKLFYNRPVIIAESTANRNGTMTGFENYGYIPLEKEYNVKLLDLNNMPTTKMWIKSELSNPLGINIINTFLDPDVYMISATRLKAHDRVIVTLSLKNISLASPINNYTQKTIEGRRNNEKGLMHIGKNSNGGKDTSYNMFRLATYGVQPDLAVLDGIVGMEGNGPVGGTPKEGKIALASTDWVAADRVGVELMGVNYDEIKYLQFCSAAGMGVDDISKMNLIGGNYRNHISTYTLNKNIDQQREWLHEDFGI